MEQKKQIIEEPKIKKRRNIIRFVPLVVGVLISIGGYFVEPPWTLFVMFLGLFAAFVPFICTDYKEIREKDEKLQHLAQSIKDNKLKYDNAYDNSLLTNAIEKALVASDNAKNDAGKSKKKIEHFLLEIAQADRLNPVNLKLDDRKYDNLYEIKGTLSITDAPVFAWKNPEYNWFLVSNYTSVLLKRLGNSTLKQIRLVSRKNNSFKSFIKEGSQILEDIKQGSLDRKSVV